jgi:hypothetical protein
MQLAQRGPQRLLDLLAERDLDGQRPHVLLRRGAGRGELRGLRHADLAVHVAHPAQRRALPVEARHRVGAQDRQRLLALQIGPQLLELDGPRVVAAGPQEVDHLAEGAHRRGVPGARLLDQAAHHLREQQRVRPRADHELVERPFRVQEDEAARRGSLVRVEAARRQAVGDQPAVVFGRDHEHGRALGQPRGHEVGDRIGQRAVVVVELDDVLRVIAARADQQVGRRCGVDRSLAGRRLLVRLLIGLE